MTTLYSQSHLDSGRKKMSLWKEGPPKKTALKTFTLSAARTCLIRRTNGEQKKREEGSVSKYPETDHLKWHSSVRGEKDSKNVSLFKKIFTIPIEGLGRKSFLLCLPNFGKSAFGLEKFAVAKFAQTRQWQKPIARRPHWRIFAM